MDTCLFEIAENALNRFTANAASLFLVITLNKYRRYNSTA